MNNSRLIDVDSCIAGQSTKQGTMECPGRMNLGRRRDARGSVLPSAVSSSAMIAAISCVACLNATITSTARMESSKPIRPRLPGPALREDVVVLAGARGALVP
jgi:hypothetical protein